MEGRHAKILGQKVPGRENGKCKGPEAGPVKPGEDQTSFCGWSMAKQERQRMNNRKGDEVVCGLEHLLLSTYCVPGPVLEAGDSAVNKTCRPQGAYRLAGQTANKYGST